MFSLILCDCSLKAGRYEEILLFQAQLFSCVMIVVRVQHLYDILSQVLLLHGFVVIAPVKGFQLEVHDGFCIPDS